MTALADSVARRIAAGLFENHDDKITLSRTVLLALLAQAADQALDMAIRLAAQRGDE